MKYESNIQLFLRIREHIKKSYNHSVLHNERRWITFFRSCFSNLLFDPINSVNLNEKELYDYNIAQLEEIKFFHKLSGEKDFNQAATDWIWEHSDYYRETYPGIK